MALPNKKNITFVPKSDMKVGNRRREDAKNDKQRLEMVRDVLDAHAVSDPDAPLHSRVTALANAYQNERGKVLRYIVENAQLRATIRHETPIHVEAPNGYRVL
jgi:hypothetical protein